MDLWATTYDYPATVTPSNTANDPAGPFAGVLCNAAGTIQVTPLNGPQAATSISIAVVEGEYLRFPIVRVWTGSPACTGLVSNIVRQGVKAT